MEDNIFKRLGELFIGAPSFDFNKAINFLNIFDEHTTITNDEIASEHYSIFGMTVFPYGHYYLTETRNFAGDQESKLIRTYQQFNFDYNKNTFGMGATHLGTMLFFLQHLQDKQQFHQMRYFISNDILSWYQVFINCINETDSKVFKKVANFTVESLINNWKKLNGNQHLDEINFYTHYFNLDEFLNNEKTSLKEISDFLITPALSGVLISRSLITKIATTLEVPVGFGERSLIMNDLIREANNYGVINKLIDVLLSYFQFHQQSFKDFEIPEISHYWIDKIETSKKLLDSIRGYSAMSQSSI